MPERKVEIDIPEGGENAIVTATREGLPEVLNVRGGLRGFKHKDIFPWHLSIVIEAKKAAETGLPTGAEFQVICAVEEEIRSVVESGKTSHGSPNALFVATSMWNKLRELLYQVHDPEVTHTALQALLNSKKWVRGWEYSLECDAKWSATAQVLKLLRRNR